MYCDDMWKECVCRVWLSGGLEKVDTNFCIIKFSYNLKPRSFKRCVVDGNFNFINVKLANYIVTKIYICLIFSLKAIY